VFVLHVVVTCMTVVAVAGIAVADLARADFVMANSAEVGVAASALPVLAALKLAGAAGLVLGLFGIRPLAVAAAIGLVAFFVGAVVVHIRARVFYNVAFPCAYLAMAVASLALTVLA
jgi:DoxX-like protein